MKKIAYLPVTEVPVQLSGVAGKAWRMNLKAARKAWVQSKQGDGKDSTVAGWVVHCPSAHPFWQYYFVAVIHLREAPGLPPPRRYGDDYTHELIVAALDPKYVPNILSPMEHYLRPMNFAAQWNAGTDIAADVKVESVVREIVNGELSPDTDHMRAWIARFNDSMVKDEFKPSTKPQR